MFHTGTVLLLFLGKRKVPGFPQRITTTSDSNGGGPPAAAVKNLPPVSTSGPSNARSAVSAASKNLISAATGVDCLGAIIPDDANAESLTQIIAICGGIVGGTSAALDLLSDRACQNSSYSGTGDTNAAAVAANGGATGMTTTRIVATTSINPTVAPTQPSVTGANNSYDYRDGGGPCRVQL